MSLPNGWIQARLPDDPPRTGDMHTETLPPRTPSSNIELRLDRLDGKLDHVAAYLGMPTP